MIRQTLLAALALLPATLAGAQSAPNAWSTTPVNFREAPGSHAAVVAWVPHCAALTTYEWQDGWVRATWEAQTGWVWGAYLAASNTHCQTGYQPPAYVPPVATYQPPAYQAPAYQAPTYHAPAYQPPVYQPPTIAYQPPAYHAPAYQPPAYAAPVRRSY